MQKFFGSQKMRVAGLALSAVVAAASYAVHAKAASRRAGPPEQSEAMKASVATMKAAGETAASYGVGGVDSPTFTAGWNDVGHCAVLWYTSDGTVYAYLTDVTGSGANGALWTTSAYFTQALTAACTSHNSLWVYFYNSSGNWNGVWAVE